MKDRLIRFDWAIKRLLRQKANFGVLEGFLTVFLGEEVKIVEILESEGNQRKAWVNPYVVDIKAEKANGEIVVVGIQYLYEVYYHERMLYGSEQSTKAYAKRCSDCMGNAYSFNVLDFNVVGESEDYMYKGQTRFKGIHTNDELNITTKQRDAIVRISHDDIFPICYFLLASNFDKKPVSPIEEWMYYLRTGIIHADAKAPGLQEARNILLYYKMDEAERHSYDEHVNAVMIQHDVLGNAHEEGRAEGREEGRAEGSAEERIEMARRFLAMGLSPEMVAQGSSLSLDEVKALIEK